MHPNECKHVGDFVTLMEQEMDEEFVRDTMCMEDNLDKPLKQIILEMIQDCFIDMYKDMLSDKTLTKEEQYPNKTQLKYWQNVLKRYKAFLLKRNI